MAKYSNSMVFMAIKRETGEREKTRFSLSLLSAVLISSGLKQSQLTQKKRWTKRLSCCLLRCRPFRPLTPSSLSNCPRQGERGERGRERWGGRGRESKENEKGETERPPDAGKREREKARCIFSLHLSLPSPWTCYSSCSLLTLSLSLFLILRPTPVLNLRWPLWKAFERPIRLRKRKGQHSNISFPLTIRKNVAHMKGKKGLFQKRTFFLWKRSFFHQRRRKNERKKSFFLGIARRGFFLKDETLNSWKGSSKKKYFKIRTRKRLI